MVDEVKVAKPHIRKVGNNWYVHVNGRLVALTTRFANLSNIGPWRKVEIGCQWFGDARRS